MNRSSQRLFVKIGEIRNMCAHAGRRFPNSTLPPPFIHVELPSRLKIYPLLVVKTFLTHTQGPVTQTSVRLFNQTTAARQAVAVAQLEFNTRLERLMAATPAPPGHLLVSQAASLVGVSADIMGRWVKDGIIPSATNLSEKHARLIPGDELNNCCKWVIPES